MIKNIIRSAYKFLFSLTLLILAAHFILINIPGNPASHLKSDFETKSALTEEDDNLRQALSKRGHFLPGFYFSVYSAALPSVYFEEIRPEEKRNIKQMAYHFGNPETVERFIKQLKKCQTYFTGDSAKIIYHQMLTDYCSTQCHATNKLNSMAAVHPDNESLVVLHQIQTEMHKHRNSWKKFIPVFSFKLKNRLHQYLFGDGENTKGIFNGSLGVSWQTQLPVAEMIFSGFRWTFTLAIVTLLISLSLSVIIGIKAGANTGSAFDRISSQSLSILYSVPVFWLAILLLMLFSNPHVLELLPSSGVQPVSGFQESNNFIGRILVTIPYLILPLICFILPSLAFMARTLRASTSEIMEESYIRTARAKGLSEHSILKKHVFRNVLLPVITLFALAWPALLSGSVIIETIFSIPGMGLLTYQAVQQQDYPVLAGVFITTGIITLITFSLADILYRMADPRLKT